jgi:hypothetical protein
MDDLMHWCPFNNLSQFVEKLEKIVPSDRFEFDIIEGAGHGGDLFKTDENLNRVFSFLDKHLKKSVRELYFALAGTGTQVYTCTS